MVLTPSLHPDTPSCWPPQPSLSLPPVRWIQFIFFCKIRLSHILRVNGSMWEAPTSQGSCLNILPHFCFTWVLKSYQTPFSDFQISGSWFSFWSHLNWPFWTFTFCNALTRSTLITHFAVWLRWHQESETECSCGHYVSGPTYILPGPETIRLVQK